MQSITFNNAIQCNTAQTYVSVLAWLDTQYSLSTKPGTTKISINSLNILQEKLGYFFKDHNLFLQALTHTSFTHESLGKSTPSNERLEFLGDSCINLVITNLLYKKFPLMSEGDLSKMRGSRVNEQIFAELAQDLKLFENIFLGKGEWKQKSFSRTSLLADAFEAIMGALYLEAGIEQVEKSFLKISEGKDFFAETILENFDFKTQLQEICMSLYSEHPQYLAKEIDGGFLVSIVLKEKCLIEERGISKKKLEKELAKIVLSEKRYLIKE